MHYIESSQILEKVKSSSKIILNCHANPDADSVGSTLALYSYLIGIGKDVRIICPNKVASNLSFLAGFEKIETVDFKNFDFSNFDLFVTLDSASWKRICGINDLSQPEVFFIVIDHHGSNQRFGKINLVNEKSPACAELLYEVLEDWGVEITQEIANCLLTGIIGDTGAFRFPEVTSKTLTITKSLMDMGADKNEIIFQLYKSYDFKTVEFWTEILKNISIDREYGFVYSAISKEVYSAYGNPQGTKSEIADMFFQSIEGTHFGMVIFQEEDNLTTVSFRSRDGFDVSRLAAALGGGGHPWAAAARLTDMPYKFALEKILSVSKTMIKNNE